MEFIKKLKHWLRIRELRKRLHNLAHLEFCKFPYTERQMVKRIDCIIYGHKWATEPQNELSKPIRQRTYCKKCGKYYSEEIYKEL